MFTGIIEASGTVAEVRSTGLGAVLRINAELEDSPSVGDSVAIDGVCLTATAVGDGWFAVEAVAETLAVTTMGSLAPGDLVNLERPVPAGGRMDGHIVQGHVDGVGRVRSITSEGDATRMWLDLPDHLLRYVANKGSIALDGVSLTVSGLDAGGVEVTIIPHTAIMTTLGQKSTGNGVNVEVDVIAKYVERLMETRS